MTMRFALIGLLLLYTISAQAGEALRLKDMGRFAGWRTNVLTGMGLVVGLAGPIRSGGVRRGHPKS
jgi:flagellar P-ring protein precursor FlgI